MSLEQGTFYSGHRRELSATMNARPRPGVLVTFTGERNWVDLAEGQFATTILRALLNTQFNPFVSVANNIQYDSLSRIVGWQFRFRWILTPGNDIYVVSLSNWLDDGDRLRMLDRRAATKIVYTRRF
ncbi:MAG: hypothetical protein HYX76_14910 [Acidobacteria bacterium]|nr:hypothetical protein [Acidobacteriota bacterium]